MFILFTHPLHRRGFFYFLHMTLHHNPYGRIPEFFQKECEILGLPLSSVSKDTGEFIRAILALPDSVHQVRMRLYLES